jgi:hypothetical protein
MREVLHQQTETILVERLRPSDQSELIEVANLGEIDVIPRATLHVSSGSWVSLLGKRSSATTGRWPHAQFVIGNVRTVKAEALPLVIQGSDHPDFASETQYFQEHMMKSSQALAAMRHKSFRPLSTAEARESDLHIAEDAALSRLRPMPDGPVAVVQMQVAPTPL